MKKIYLLISAVIIVILAVNIYYYFDIYDQQIDFQENFLLKQTQICGYEIEQTGQSFRSEANKILFSNDLAYFFESPDIKDQSIKQLELFYSKFDQLITNIIIFDNNKNVFSLFKDRKNQFITDTYTTHDQRELKFREVIETVGKDSYFYLPIFKNNQVTGNLLVTFEIVNYIASVFEKSHLGTTQWQWLIDLEDEGKIVTNNLAGEELNVTQMLRISEGLLEGVQGSIKHSIILGEEKEEIISAYYPTQIFSKEYGVVFSLKTDFIAKTVVKNAIIISVVTLLLISLIIFIFVFFILRKGSEEQDLKESERALKQLIESLPIGILVLGSDNIIRRTNKAALKMFSLKGEEDLVGKDISDRFLFGKNLLHMSKFGSSFDANQIITYEKNGDEIVIYKKDIPVVLQGEEVLVEAFIDVTPLEKARKQESLANEAKSDFLAKMSHEIRTPLNGIIGMAEAFLHQKLNKEQQEFAVIIRKSADLLLSIINDILDFSKIEAGKMMLEEIPFRLGNEVQFASQLFSAKASDKNLELNLHIEPDVPDNIIGDPFRLRQVLSNLIDNAIKFTDEGKIEVRVTKKEEYSGNITLQFDIEDTGIGIPEENIDGIFSSFVQVEGSISRKYGGSGLGTTISKQLVNLMGGEIWIESPSRIFINPEFPGSRFSFTIEVFSNEKIKKDIDFEDITKYHQIKTLIINEKTETDDLLLECFQNFGISSYVSTFQDRTIDMIKTNANNKAERYKMILIHDTKSFDGFQVAQKLHLNKLSDKFLIIILSANDKKGNFARSKKLGVDYYLLQPFQSSEIFDLIQDNFTNIQLEMEESPTLDKIPKNLKILVAEDNLINQKVATTIFKNLGFEITIAENGDDVLQKVKEKKYDIVFMDIMMPEKDGFDATENLRKSGYKIPIVALTADTNVESREKVLAVGMDDYIPKPIRVDEIKRVLIKWFSGSAK